VREAASGAGFFGRVHAWRSVGRKRERVCVCLRRACVYCLRGSPRAWLLPLFSAPLVPRTQFAYTKPPKQSPSPPLSLRRPFTDRRYPPFYFYIIVVAHGTAVGQSYPLPLSARSSLARLGALAQRDPGHPLSFIFLFLTSPRWAPEIRHRRAQGHVTTAKGLKDSLCLHKLDRICPLQQQ
jgi:hypothetical protein